MNAAKGLVQVNKQYCEFKDTRKDCEGVMITYFNEKEVIAIQGMPFEPGEEYMQVLRKDGKFTAQVAQDIKESIEESTFVLVEPKDKLV